MLEINLSGHPVGGIDVSPLVGVNVDMTSAASLVDCVNGVLSSLPSEVIDSLSHGEQVRVVLPGMSPLSAVFLAVFHGRFGFFPCIKWAVRGDNSGFVFTDEASADLSAIRLSSRSAR